MARTPQPIPGWKERLAVVSATMHEVHTRLSASPSLSPVLWAAIEEEMRTVLEEFALFGVVPEEFWLEHMGEETDEPT